MSGKIKPVNLPVESVSWEMGIDFLNRLRRKTGLPFRYPTEAEWEYACRAGSAGDFGIDAGNDRNVNFTAGGSWDPWDDDVPPTATRPSTDFPPNAWGLRDMHGNVEDWCGDWFGSYSATSTVDPQGPFFGFSRISRGGSHGAVLESCTSWNRDHHYPSFARETTGIRLALSVSGDGGNETSALLPNPGNPLEKLIAGFKNWKSGNELTRELEELESDLEKLESARGLDLHRLVPELFAVTIHFAKDLSGFRTLRKLIPRILKALLEKGTSGESAVLDEVRAAVKTCSGLRDFEKRWSP